MTIINQNQSKNQLLNERKAGFEELNILMNGV